MKDNPPTAAARTDAPPEDDPGWFAPPGQCEHLGHDFDPDEQPIGHQLATEHQAREDRPETATEVAP